MFLRFCAALAFFAMVLALCSEASAASQSKSGQNHQRVSAGSGAPSEPEVRAAHNQWLEGAQAAAARFGCIGESIEQLPSESVDDAIRYFAMTAEKGSCLILSPVSKNPSSMRYSFARGGKVEGIEIRYISDVPMPRIKKGVAIAASNYGVAQLTVAVTKKTVSLSPTENLQAVVNAQPAGTTFVLAPGVYRMQSIQPKSNDVFNGQGTAIFNGSQVLSFKADPAGTGHWVAGVTVLPVGVGQCQSIYPLCAATQDLFIDGQLQAPATTQVGLTQGMWYLDRAAGKVYIAASPAGHIVEIGMSPFAFGGTATGVQIENLIVEQYANPAQSGAVGAYKDGTGWIVNNVESRFNHGTGISLGPAGQILNSYSHSNGQMGIAIVGGSGSKVTGNELSWNNLAGYVANWEAGGSKFWNTTNLLVENNYAHDNNGNGLWTDYNNTGTVYQGNIVLNNFGSGIVHEISFAATIQGNVVENNSNGSADVLSDPQILLSNSSSVTVTSNIVEVPNTGADGIGLLNIERGTGPQGLWVTANNNVNHNTVIYNGTNGRSGILDYLGNNTAVGNHIDYDRYILEDSGAAHWLWFNKMSWSQLQGAGQETHGQCCK